MTQINSNQAIGVFDSGIGGLTVLKALKAQLPQEDFIYLGDTARLPYGTKSQTTVINYAKQALAILNRFNIKLLVIACNTASALALAPLQAEEPHLSILGVLAPGAQAACELSESGKIALLATEATVHSQSYVKTIQKIRPEAKVIAQACPLFVTLAEIGWHDNVVAQEAAKIYLKALKNEDNLDCLLLGCTHFPVLKNLLRSMLDPSIKIVDSADATARAVKNHLTELSLHKTSDTEGKTSFLVTDSPERFSTTAEIFLGESITLQHIEPVCSP